MLTSSSARFLPGVLTPSAAFLSFASHTPRRRREPTYTKSNRSFSRCSSSLRFQERPSSESISIKDGDARIEDAIVNIGVDTTSSGNRASKGNEEEDEELSGIQVPRQKYIPISKSQLLDAIVLILLEEDGDGFAEEFVRLSSCLDSILHAEHKGVLEDMRVDYALTHCGEQQGSDGEVEIRMGLDYGLEELRKLLLGYSRNKDKTDSGVDFRYVDFK